MIHRCVGGMEVHGHVAEGAAPLHHRRVEVRMRDGDRLEAAEALDQGHGGVIQQRDAVPQDVAVRRADEQRALADGECRLRADADQARLVLAPGIEVAGRSAVSVVQLCPAGGTNCRSSSQITHWGGAAALGGYWVPQAVQM